MSYGSIEFNSIKIIKNTKFSKIRCFLEDMEVNLEETLFLYYENYAYEILDAIYDFFNGTQLDFNHMSLTKINIGEQFNFIPVRAFYGCDSLKEVSMENIKEINEFAFFDCENLENIKFSNNLYIIKDYAFSNCKSINKIKFNEELRIIGESVFENCIKLQEINLTPHIGTIGDYTFNNCISLKNISFNKKIAIINEFTFSGCENLENIVIPKNIKLIRNFAFENCKNLKLICCENKNIDIEIHSFTNKTGYMPIIKLIERI